MAEYYAQPVEYPNPPLQPDGRQEPRPEGMPTHAHEGTDIDVRPLVYIGVGLVIFLIITCVFLVFLFELFSKVEHSGNSKVTALEGAAVATRPTTGPIIQGIPGYHDNTPSQDMKEFRAFNADLLKRYTPARADGTAQIPVERAMELAIEQKLFKSAAPATTKAEPVAPAAAAATPVEPAKATKEKEVE